MMFLHGLCEFGLPQQLLIHFRSAVIHFVLFTSIILWFWAGREITGQDQDAVQKLNGRTQSLLSPSPELLDFPTENEGE